MCTLPPVRSMEQSTSTSLQSEYKSLEGLMHKNEVLVLPAEQYCDKYPRSVSLGRLGS